MEISRTYLANLANRYHNLKGRHERAIQKGEKVVSQVGKSLEIGGSAFLFGVMNGRMGGVELLGVPVDLLAGVAGHLAGFTLVGDKTARHLHNISDGALASFAATAGRGIGADWRRTGRLFPGKTGVHGEIGAGGGGEALDDSELSRLAHSIP